MFQGVLFVQIFIRRSISADNHMDSRWERAQDSRRSELDWMLLFKNEVLSTLLRAEGLDPWADLVSTEIDEFSISSCIRIIRLTGK